MMSLVIGRTVVDIVKVPVLALLKLSVALPVRVKAPDESLMVNALALLLVQVCIPAARVTGAFKVTAPAVERRVMPPVPVVRVPLVPGSIVVVPV